jgi:cytochrome P450
MDVFLPADAVAAVSHRDPYPYYAHLVADRPFVFDEKLSSWVAASADAVTAVLSSDLCGVRPVHEPVPKSLLGSEAVVVFGNFIRMHDREDRPKQRRALAAALDSIDESKLKAAADRHARSLLGAGGLPPNLAVQLPAYVIADLLGVPADRIARVSELIEDFVRCLAPGGGHAEIDRGKRAAEELADFFRSLLAGLDLSTSDTLIARIRRELQAVGCDDAEIAIANAIGFLFQAHDATAALTGNGLVALARRRELVAAATADRDVLRSALAEVIRFDSPVQNSRRYVARAGEIAGVPVNAGDAILVVLAAANRDPRANDRPDHFEIDRPNRKSFTFGLGVHACLGESLATTIAMAGIGCVLASGMDLAPFTTPVRYRPSPNVRTPEFASDVSLNSSSRTSHRAALDLPASPALKIHR